MAHNITIAGATYPAVPSIDIPSGNNTASFYATNDANVLAKDISNGKIAYSSNGKITGTMPTYANPTLGVTGYDSSGSTYLLTGATDPAGQFCSSDGQATIAFPKALMGNATAADVASGKTFTSQNGIAITGTASGGGGSYDVTVTFEDADDPNEYSTDHTYTISDDTYITYPMESLVVTPTKTQQVTSYNNPWSGTAGAYEVVVEPIPSQYIVPTGTLSITQNGTTDVTNYASVNVSVSGGATNLVTGTFTPSTTGSVGTVTIPYTGTGYPIMCAIFPAAGSYKSSTDIYTLIQQYAVVEWYMSKANTALAPTYTTSGGANYGCTAWVYKSSTSSATTYSRSSAMTTNTFSSSNATAAGATCVRFTANKTLKYYTASTSYGLVSGTEYRYVICYSG